MLPVVMQFVAGMSAGLNQLYDFAICLLHCIQQLDCCRLLALCCIFELSSTLLCMVVNCRGYSVAGTGPAGNDGCPQNHFWWQVQQVTHSTSTAH